MLVTPGRGFIREDTPGRGFIREELVMVPREFKKFFSFCNTNTNTKKATKFAPSSMSKEELN